MSISSGSSDVSDNSQTHINEIEENNSDLISNHLTISKHEELIDELNLSKDFDQEIWLLIFKYCGFKSLLKLSLVSKKWHKMIIPIIYRSIKLTRYKYKQLKYQDNNLSQSEQFEAEVKDCISINGKYSEVIKVFKWMSNMQFSLAVEFFSVFNQIQVLYISQISLGEDQILFSLRHLSQLKDLIMDRVSILSSDITESEYIRLQLPSSLTTININDVELDGECKAFIDIFKDHKHFDTLIHDQYLKKPFLIHFKKPYHQLNRISIFDYTPENPTTVVNVFKYNPQLYEVKYSATKFMTIIVDSINLHLTNLTRLSLIDTGAYANADQLYPKMNLPNLKFLVVRLVTFNIEFLKGLLTSATELESLDIGVNENWKKWTKIISSKCKSLKHLTFYCAPIYSLKGERYLSLTKSFRAFMATPFACDDTLRTFGLVNFSPYMAHQSQLEHFTNLNLIHFKDYVNYYPPSAIKKIVGHIHEFDQFPIIKFSNTVNGFKGYLKKTSIWTSTSYNWKTDNSSAH